MEYTLAITQSPPVALEVTKAGMVALAVESVAPTQVAVTTVTNALQVVKASPTQLDVLSAGIQGPRGVQGLPGASGGSFTSGENLSGHIAVVLNSAGEAVTADVFDPLGYMVMGITIGASISGAPAAVQTSGSIEHSGWTFTPGQAVFLGANGSLVQTLPPLALFMKVLGMAISPTRMGIDFQQAIFQ